MFLCNPLTIRWTEFLRMTERFIKKVKNVDTWIFHLNRRNGICSRERAGAIFLLIGRNTFFEKNQIIFRSKPEKMSSE